MTSDSNKIRRLSPIRQRQWIRILTDRDRIRVEFTARGNAVSSVDVIQYEAEIAGEWLGVVRYDMAHGFFHRDIMHPDGTQEKTKVSYRNLTEAVVEAMDFIEAHWEFYRRIYEEQVK